MADGKRLIMVVTGITVGMVRIYTYLEIKTNF